jgi:DNA-binding phage protein
VVLEVSDRGRSGFLGVSQRFTGVDALYFTSVEPEFIRARGGNPADWPKAQGGKILLGYYRDARVAAYVRAYYEDHGAELISRFNAIVATPGGTTRRHKVEHEGAVLPVIPVELFNVPNDYAELMRNYPAQPGARKSTVKVTVAGTMSQWSQLLRDYGVTGEGIYRALGGTPADQTFVLGLRTLGYNEAKAALVGRGLDLDGDGVQRIEALA